MFTGVCTRGCSAPVARPYRPGARGCQRPRGLPASDATDHLFRPGGHGVSPTGATEPTPGGEPDPSLPNRGIPSTSVATTWGQIAGDIRMRDVTRHPRGSARVRARERARTGHIKSFVHGSVWVARILSLCTWIRPDPCGWVGPDPLSHMGPCGWVGLTPL